MECPNITDWITAIGSIVSAIAIIFIAWKGIQWSHKIWLKQQQKGRVIQREEMQYEYKLKAIYAAWSLLIYLTKEENGNTIFVHRTDSKGDRKPCFRKKQAEEFCEKIFEIHYTKGNGVFIDKEIRDILFDLKRGLHRLLDAERENADDIIDLRNEEWIDRKNAMFDKLTVLLKSEAKNLGVEKPQ